MGLVDWDGKELIPVQYELIGNFRFDTPNIVEIKTATGYGLYSLDIGEVVRPVYEWIVPSKQNLEWVAIKDGNAFPIKELTISNTTISLSDIMLLDTGRIISNKVMAMNEGANVNSAGSGLMVTPSYLYKTGYYPEIETDFSMNENNLYRFGGWKDYVRVTNSFFSKLNNGFNVWITEFKERFLEGRAEFYDRGNIVLTDSLNSKMFNVKTSSNGDLKVRIIGDSLVEMNDLEGEYDDMALPVGPNGVPPELQIDGRSYTYYTLTDSGFKWLGAGRIFNFTKFVAMDSSYIFGDFRVWSNHEDKWIDVSSMPLKTLEYMRDEILGDNGLEFPEGKAPIHLVNMEAYKPRYKTEEELQPHLSAIDKHNLDFLARVIAKMKAEPLP